MNWIINGYKDIDGERVLDQIEMFDNYITAKKTYWDNKSRLRDQGIYIELKPMKGFIKN